MTEEVKTYPVRPIDNVTAYAVELSNIHATAIAQSADRLKGAIIRVKFGFVNEHLDIATAEVKILQRKAEEFADRVRALSEAISNTEGTVVSQDEKRLCPLTFSSESPKPCREDCAWYKVCNKR